MSVKFNVRWSKTVKSITFFMVVIIAIAETVLICEGAATSWVLAAVAALIAVVAIYFIMLAPLSVELADKHILLHKLGGKILLPYVEMKDIALYTFSDSDRRLFASGGFCGYTGIFFNQVVGRYYAFVGDRKDAFMVRMNDGKNYLLSCTDHQVVIDNVNSNIERNTIPTLLD